MLTDMLTDILADMSSWMLSLPAEWFSGKMIAGAVLGPLLLGAGLILLQHKGAVFRILEWVFVGVGFLLALFGIIAGLRLLALGWTVAIADPTANSSVNLHHVSGLHGGRAGVILLVIRFWPYVLTGFSAYWIFILGGGLVRLFLAGRNKQNTERSLERT